DIRNPTEVEWALSTRMQPDRDLIIIPRLACSTLDPSVPKPRSTAGWGIDATVPVADRSKYEKVLIPGVEKIKYI
ncbi:MAG TPA: UbiD family decarboxylase, partial [Candidatus Binatia bacterium]